MSPSGNKRKKTTTKVFLVVWFPAYTLVKALSISSYISPYHRTIIYKCTVHEKEKLRLRYLPRSLLSTHLMHGLICNVCYYITCIYCSTKSVHRTFSVSRVLLGREPCGLWFWGLPYGRFGHSCFLKEIAVVWRVLVKM